MIITEIWHFGQLEPQKNEFKVCKSNLQRLISGCKINETFFSIFTKLQTQFFHLLIGQNEKLLCSLRRKCSEFCYHHRIFVFKPIPLKVMVIQTSEVFWGDHPEGRVFQI